ncbi:MAG: hypothetical protein AVDCRST_MAG02-1074 [uncultured Rubrobacteraceae bacterium]|uniref:Uncharacterized protein n=1 Tax=uncultured Rubrobacteraceae bacterium TaxID=349277 RepID=A0A6J4QRG8_9ACTN|nr:MAG: hypothetical protein AVDCRST_MAG02-1074 [uncultured Rubrobacteraceae bacterium]
MRHRPDDARHVAGCDDCQARASLGHTGLDVDLERVWTGVAAEAWATPVAWPERAMGRLLGSPGLARALVTTPSLFLSWILASVAVLAAGVLLAPLSGDPWAALLAPALAGAGIAYAYGPGADPAFELSRTMATSGRMVLLVRALCVFGLNAALGLVASLFSATAVGLTLGWLVPMTTVSALALAAATLSRSANVGVFVALSSWGFVVTTVFARTRDLAVAVESWALMPFYLVATVGLVALTLYVTTGNRGKDLTWG